MKGGVTCLGAMFCRKTKNAIADDAVTLQKHEVGDSSPTVEEDTGFSRRLLSGRATSVACISHDVRAVCGQGDLHVFVPNDVVATVVEPATSSIHDIEPIGIEADASHRPLANFSSESGLGEVEYEGEDEDEDTIARNAPRESRESREYESDHAGSDDASDLTLNREYATHTKVLDSDSARYYQDSVNRTYEANMERQNSFTDLDICSGHVSDPGVCRTKKLESTCSLPILAQGAPSEEEKKNEKRSLLQVSLGASSESESVRLPDTVRALSGHQNMLLSYETSSAGGEARDLPRGACVPSGGSPRSEGTYQCDVSHAMFKLGASSRAMAAQKRNPWWKMFLVSHRNIHREVDGAILGSLSGADVERMSSANGYVSDMEARTVRGSPSVLNEGVYDSQREQDILRGSEQGRSPGRTDLFLRNVLETPEAFEGPKAGLSSEISAIPPYQGGDSAHIFKPSSTAQKWDAFTGKSGFSRVEEWVSTVHPIVPFLDDDQGQIDVEDSPGSPTASAASFFGHFGRVFDNSKQVPGAVPRGDGAVDVDTEMANIVARSVNPLSTVAQFSGVGLKVVPSLGMFGSLKTLNLSANSFVRITVGCLPKSLHSLDISRNSIHVIEGLRELTRLRVLNLSFNRISRIGNGLSSCTSLKEVYLAGNKVSEVEGLHRLSKLVVLDLSFNKLTTTKSLGQIAANYKSLQALNLLGNAVQSNLGDEQMRRLVTGICPQLAYLNKQALKTVSNREALGKELKGSCKSMPKPSKRGSGHQSMQSHRRTHSGGLAGSVKSKPGGKGVVSPILVGQGDGHYRKAHHQNRSTSTKELPKGFVPLLPNTFGAERGERVLERSEIEALPRVKSDGALFREDNRWSSTTVSRGVVQAH